MQEVSAKFPVTQMPDAPTDKAVSSSLPPDKRDAMTEVAIKHGFKDLQEWSDVAQSVVMSYAYLREGKGLNELDKMVDRMVAQAENDSKLTDEQRQKAIAQVRELGASWPSCSLCRRITSLWRR